MNEETMAQLLPDPIDPSLSSINNNNQREMHYIVFLLRIDLWEAYRISLCLLSSGDCCCWWCYACSSNVAIATEAVVISSMMLMMAEDVMAMSVKMLCTIADHLLCRPRNLKRFDGENDKRRTIALTIHSFFSALGPAVDWILFYERNDRCVCVCVVIILCVCVCRSVLCIKSMMVVRKRENGKNRKWFSVRMWMDERRPIFFHFGEVCFPHRNNIGRGCFG